MPDVVPGQHVSVVLGTSTTVLQLPAVVRSVDLPAPATTRGGLLPDADGTVQLGLEFLDVPEQTAADLALALFRTGIAPRLTPVVAEVPERSLAA
jgi:hypothetical protein